MPTTSPTPTGDGTLVLWMLAIGSVLAGLWLWRRWGAHKRRVQERSEQWPADWDIEDKRQWARQRALYWWDYANGVHDETLEPEPTIEFSKRLKHALGWADSGRNLIKISEFHLEEKSKRVADETIAHEIAHIFADRYHERSCRHGKKWKDVMIAMGQRPDVYFIDTPEDEQEADAKAAREQVVSEPAETEQAA